MKTAHKAKPKPRPVKTKPRAKVINLRDVVNASVTTALARRPPAPTITAETIAAQPFAHGNTHSIFSAEQQRIISEPARDEELDVRPDNGAVYMPHVHIRRRLSKAFGVGGWRLLPAPGAGGAPQRQAQGRKAENIYQTWQLWIGNYAQPVAEAIGFARYYANNPSMDYGDAIEAAKSNALMRCGKSIDVGDLLEWDKFEQSKWRKRMCVVVMVPRRNGGWRAQWRRADADPFPDERAPQPGERVQFTREAVDEGDELKPPTPRGEAPRPPNGPRPAPPPPTKPLRSDAIGGKGKPAAEKFAPPENVNEPQVFTGLKERAEIMWAQTKHAHGESVYIVNEQEHDAQIQALIDDQVPCVVSWRPSTKKPGAFVLVSFAPLRNTGPR